jgi:hypothetical protein
LNFRQHNSAAFLSKALKLLGLVALVLFLSESTSFAQNTKGDRAEMGTQRQNRFNKGKRHKRPKSSQKRNRVTPNRLSPANALRGSKHSPPKKIYSQKSIYVNNDNRNPGKEKAVYPQRGKFANNPSRNPNRVQRSRVSNASVVVRSRSNKSRNVYPQYGKYTNNPSRKPKSVQRSVSNRSTLARLNKLQGPSKERPPRKKRRIVPRSASSSFIRHKTINTNAGFWNVKKKGEVAVMKDVAGRPLRTKNYQTPPREVIPSPVSAKSKRKRIGDRPYKGSASGRYVSATKQTQRAWRGDIAKRRIRGLNFTSKSHVEGNPIPAQHGPKPRKRDKPYKGFGLNPRAPGIGADGLGNYSGNLKGRRPLKGGGSRSGRLWNNQNSALQGRTPGMGADGLGKYQGNLKGNRPQKGGGSRSGKLWNNKGLAVQGRTPGIGADRVGTFQGNIKGHRPLKGGGSRSGKLWNNKGIAVQGRTPGIGADRIGTFQGNIKGGRPLKGGGSRSGKLWNNNGIAIQGRTPGIGANKIGTFQGNIKTGRPLKGGGSVSGRLWNNKQTPIVGRVPSSNAMKVGGYPGNIRRFQQSPGFSNQGEEFTGYIKTYKPEKGGGSRSGKLWNNKEAPIPVLSPSQTILRASYFRGNNKRFEQNPGFNDQGEEFTGFIKLSKFKRNYLKNPNAAEEAIKKRRENKNTYKVDKLQIKVERRDYVKNKNSAEEALKKLAPTKTTTAVGNLQVKVKQYNYIHNGSSATNALNVREPGKAFARATDYQGNIKMKKIDFTKMFSERNRELHPDAKFVKTNKNNVAEERSFMTNVKLWWSRTFRKSETQPDHLKEREHKPRYDKDEQGLWND